MPQNQQTNSSITIRMPKAQDGKLLFALAKQSGELESNSEYAYLLFGAHFSKTCAIAEENDKPLGFVSAYILPEDSDVLFIWQIASHPNHRHRGLAKKMLFEILNRRVCRAVRFVQASVTPSNIASQRLFESLARDLGSSIKRLNFFPRFFFSKEHEEEQLFHIGPFLNINK